MFGSQSIGAGQISFYLINKHGLFGLGLDGSVKFGLGMGLNLGTDLMQGLFYEHCFPGAGDHHHAVLDHERAAELLRHDRHSII